MSTSEFTGPTIGVLSLDPGKIQKWLANQWHRDQCACDAWPEACIYRDLVPLTWTTDAVVDAIKGVRR